MQTISTPNDMQAKLDRNIIEASKVGLEINISKTQVLRIGTAPLHINNQVIENVEQFCYYISKDGGTDYDINCRIGSVSVHLLPLPCSEKPGNLHIIMMQLK